MLTVFRYETDSPIKSACRVATGRSAALHMAKRWNPEVVYMPCYVPEGIIKPFRAAGVIIRFYKLDPSLCPDFADLDRKMDEDAPSMPVIVIIHYFGMRASTFEAQKLAAKFGGIVLSDSAHCIPFGDCSFDADVTLYSLNKFIAVPDGAIMLSRRDDLDVTVHENAPTLPVGALQAYYSHLSANRQIARAAPSSDISQLAAQSAKYYGDYYKLIDDDMSVHSQSAFSRAVEAKTDFYMMKRLRQGKSDFLAQRIIPNRLVQHNQSCEFAFPVRCGGYKDEMASALYRAGVVPCDLVSMWDHIPTGEGYDVETVFVDDHLLLPINEAVDMKDMLLMAEIVNSFR
jgi:hypothetical protein